MRLLKRGGETTELSLPHRGVRLYDAAMDQDSGIGACTAVSDGYDVFDGWEQLQS